MESILQFLKDYYFLFILGGIVTSIVLYRKTVKGKRIDDEKKALMDLIKEIHSSKFNIQYGTYEILENGGGSGGSSGIANLTIFKMQKYNSEVDNSDYEDAPVFFEKGSNYILDFEKHIQNPTMPRRIKKILKKFNNHHFTLFNHHQQSVGEFDYVMIDNGKFTDMAFLKLANDTRFKLGNAIAYQSYLSFITCCTELENKIINWSRVNNAGMDIENDFD